MAVFGRLFGAVAFATIAAAPAPAQAAATNLGTAYYSPAWKVVVIPYHGALPSYVLGTAQNPPRVFLDFKAAYAVGTRHGSAPGHPALRSWSMAPRNAATTRVTLSFRTPTTVRVVHNAQKKLIMLVPQSAGAPVVRTAPKPAPNGAALGTPRWDPERRAVVIPYRGRYPNHEMGIVNNPPRVFVDLAAPGLKDPVSGVVRGHPTLVGFSAAARSSSVMRVVLTFKSPTEILVQNDHVRHEVLLVPQNTAPTPAPLPVETPSAPDLPPPELQDPTLAPPRPQGTGGGDPTEQLP